MNKIRRRKGDNENAVYFRTSDRCTFAGGKWYFLLRCANPAGPYNSRWEAKNNGIEAVRRQVLDAASREDIDRLLHGSALDFSEDSTLPAKTGWDQVVG